MQFINYIPSFFVEIILLVVYPLCGFIGIFWKLRTNDIPNTKKVIVYVNPWISHNVIYYFLKRYLEKYGYTVYIVDYGFRVNDYEKAAQLLDTFIQEHKLTNITLIASSNSAVTCLLYLQRHKGWNNTKKFISLGGTFYGTPLAYIVAFTNAGRQLLPNNSLIKTLHKQKIIHKKVLCISTKYDELVPITSSALTGCKHIILNNYGHNYFHTVSITTFKTVLRYL